MSQKLREMESMLRSFFIYMSKAGWARKMVTRWGAARRVADRFVAGETLEEGIRTARALNEKGMYVTLDHLGEHTYSVEEARRATQDILAILEAIERTGVRSNVSIKLTQIGMGVDKELCAENLRAIVKRGSESGIFTRIDMEDTPWTDTTLGLYRQMRETCGARDVGVVIQTMLYRSEEDIRELAKLETRVRLCKGAYQEPAEVAFPKKSDVDANYDRLGEILMDCAREAGSPASSADGKVPALPALATHDERRIEHAKAYAAKIGLPKEALEFQFLHGIRRDLQEQLVKEGYPVRIYVPFGTEWYPYFTRRLAERPANVWFFISNFVRR
jgi:proline dehydrogenase